MKKNLRLAFLSAFLLTALTLNAAFPQPALADEVPPPPPDTSEQAPTDPPPADPPPTEEPTEVAPTEEPAPTEVLTDMPAETELVVLDENGNPLALTTTEAALIIATGDPMWCPAGILPGGAGCTTQFSNFNGAGGLLDVLKNNPVQYSGPGTIFIAFDYTTAVDGAIAIDGNDGYGIEDLTIQGGWDFGLNQYSGAPTTLEDALDILNWDYDVTLNDLLFDGASLTVATSGDIELNNVEVKDNAVGYGAELDNTAGINSTIEVNSSSFHDNFTIGIQALSNGGIALTDVDAYGNNGAGAVLDNSGSAFAGSVTIWTSTFNDNGATGLDVSSNGAIFTVDLEASGNNGYGAVLDNSLSDDPQSVTVGALYGPEFNDNFNSGLTVLSQGDITVYQATANNNGNTSNFAGAGAYLDNTYGNGNTYAYGEFSGNYADGLDVYSNGNVELWYVIAEENGNSGNASSAWGIGTYIDNCNWDGLSCDGTGWVEVNDSEFNSNYSDGLWVYAPGAIELNDVVANDNGNTGNATSSWGMGAYLDNSDGTGGVTIDGGEFGNFAAGGNYSDGLNVYSTGDIYVSYVFAENNGTTGNGDTAYGNGAILDNCLEDAGACAGSGYVYVFTSEFNDNYADGLQAFASENIWLNYYVSANDNGQSLSTGNGALLVNNFNGSTGSILLYGPITVNNNYNTGLIAESNGDVTMSGVEGNFNLDSGATVTTTAGTVTIENSTFNSNGVYGVDVAAEGDVEFTDVAASNNDTFGAAISSATGDVTVEDSTFNSNQGTYGLDISAFGDVSLAAVDAIANKTYGAQIGAGGNTTITTGRFNGNLTTWGLNVGSGGDVSLADIEANANKTYGALISNSGNTTVTTGLFNGNLTTWGLNVGSGGEVSLTDVEASSNKTYGAQIGSGGSTTIDTGLFNGNLTDWGLNVGSGADVVLTDVEANANKTYGAQISNGGGNTTIDTSLFNGNLTTWGLSIGSGGDVSLTDVEVNANKTYGALISNGGNTTIDTSLFNGNLTDWGLSVGSGGDVALTDVEANANKTYGAQIGSGGGTSIVNGFFNGNLSAHGLDVSSFSDVSLTNGSASNNATYGADVTSSFGSLTVNGGTFDDNIGAGGLDGTANSDITLAGVQASHNGGTGVSLTSTNGGISVEDSVFQGNAGDGLYLVSSADADVRCIFSTGNSGYGLDATAPGSLFLKIGDLSGNTLGPMDVSGVGTLLVNDVGCDEQDLELEPLPAPPALPWTVFHIGGGGESQGLNCTEFGGTVLTLPNGDHVSIPCPVTGEATLKAVEDTGLPGDLGESYTFVSGMDIQVEPPPGSDMLVDFLMPGWGSESNMMILHWDGSAWVDRGGLPVTDNFLEISTQETGVYVLVSQ